MRKKWQDRAGKFNFVHSSLLALVVVIFQVGKPYSNLDINNKKYNSNKQSTVEQQCVNACMSPNILNDDQWMQYPNNS